MKQDLLDQSFDDLAHALRRLMEADWDARARLMAIDRAEAVGNIDSAFTAVLNAFHSIHDILGNAPGSPSTQWFSIGPLALVLAVRNARHHNHANKIRSIYTRHVQEAPSPDEARAYILIDFPREDSFEGAFSMHLSWGDLRTYFDMPSRESFLKESTRETIEEYLGSRSYKTYASDHGCEESQVMFNAIAVVVDAGVAMLPFIADRLHTTSSEGHAYRAMFETSIPSDPRQPVIKKMNFRLPG